MTEVKDIAKLATEAEAELKIYNDEKHALLIKHGQKLKQVFNIMLLNYKDLLANLLRADRKIFADYEPGWRDDPSNIIKKITAYIMRYINKYYNTQEKDMFACYVRIRKPNNCLKHLKKHTT